MTCLFQRPPTLPLQPSTLPQQEKKLTNKVLPGVGSVERVVDNSNDPIKHSGVQRLGSGRNGKSHLVFVLTLFDKIFADLQQEETKMFEYGQTTEMDNDKS